MNHHTNNFQKLLTEFTPVSLEEMDEKMLMNRVDTKYIFAENQLSDVLKELGDGYSILTINGHCTTTYRSHYFDTENFELFYKHQRGKANRHKVRYRTYVESGLSFFEIKCNTNKGRTNKERIKMDSVTDELNEKSVKFLHQHTIFKAAQLSKVLEVEFIRITLVNKFIKERITFDTQLKVKNGSGEICFNNLVIAEVKQDKQGASLFVNLMKKEHVHKGSVSKYCLGILAFNKGMKYNNFKPNLRYINNIVYGGNTSGN